MKEENKMTKNEIKNVNKNWKEFTGYNNSVEFWKENNNNSKLLQDKINEFIKEYKYTKTYNLWHYLTYGW